MGEISGNENEVAWTVVDSFFTTKHLASQQIDSYNHFVLSRIPEMLKTHEIIEHVEPDKKQDGTSVVHQVRLKFNRYVRPVDPGNDIARATADDLDDAERLMPYESRLRDLTYAARLHVDMYYTVLVRRRVGMEFEEEEIHSSSKEDILAAHIPAMLQSATCHLAEMQGDLCVPKRGAELAEHNECMQDKGGYFIVNGSEKVVIAQESIRRNHVFVFSDVTSTVYSHRAEIRSERLGANRGLSKINLKLLARPPRVSPHAPGVILLENDRFDTALPLTIFMRALGVVRIQDILKCVTVPTDTRMCEALRPTLAAASTIENQDVAFQKIAVHLYDGDPPENYKDKVVDFLTNRILPHMGDNFFGKAVFLGYMAHRLLSVKLGRSSVDDRDHYANKRVQLAGSLLEQLFRPQFDAFCKKVQKEVGKLVKRKQRSQVLPNQTGPIASEIKEELSKAHSDDYLRVYSPLNSDDIANLIASDSAVISKTISSALSTGNWATDAEYQAPSGVSQNLDRLSFSSSVSHLRRVSSKSADSNGKNVKARFLHNTQWGVMCPAETPEGKPCGLTKNLALMCTVTLGNAKSVDDILQTFKNAVDHTHRPDGHAAESSGPDLTEVVRLIGDRSVMEKSAFPWTMVMLLIGGRLVAHVYPKHADDILQLLRHLRSTGKFGPPEAVSVVYNRPMREIRITTDSGRCARPLFVVDTDSDSPTRTKLKFEYHHYERLLNGNHFSAQNGLSEFQRTVSALAPERREYWAFSDLVHTGVVEIVDVEEEETLLLHLSLQDYHQKQSDRDPKTDEMRDLNHYTHCEIHPATILGALGGLIPFPEHNQSPRNTYQCAMGKQAMGIYATSLRVRMDTQGHMLHYAQKPLVETRPMTYVGFRKMPAGINAVVAIMCYGGYNQEDSVLMNLYAVDRGFFHSTFFQTTTIDADAPGNPMAHGSRANRPMVYVELPNESIRKGGLSGSAADYSHLDDDGIIFPGVAVSGLNNYVLVGRVKHNPLGIGLDEPTQEDKSQTAKPTDTGRIDRVMVTTTPKDNKLLVKIRQRTYRVPEIGDKFSSRHGQKGTCGMLYKQSDMPFNRFGMSPDIIINPHAVPSRMTIGQLKECVFSKAATLSGSCRSGTAFSNIETRDVSRDLHQQFGFQRHGNERLINGMFGNVVDSMVFMGPTFYQRLKHMVADKVHARRDGFTQNLTRQPTEGRSRDGGLRFGEMERDCVVAHGCSAFLSDRMCLSSDEYQVLVCRRCGVFAGGTNSYQLGATATFQRRNDDIAADMAVARGELKCPGCSSVSDLVRVSIPYMTKLVFQELMAMNVMPRLVVSQQWEVGTKVLAEDMHKLQISEVE